MEIIFKLVVTCIGTWIYIASICWIWTHQIDVKESTHRFFKFLT